jgi:disulfide bond formation protein DsbB
VRSHSSMDITSFVIKATALGTLISHIVLVLLGVALMLRVSAVARLIKAISPHVFVFGLIISAFGIVGSLLYSEVIGYEPCVLCWVERVFLYPQAIIFAVAVWKKDVSIVPYILWLSVLGAIVSLYHAYTQLGGYSVTPCTSAEGSCAKVYVLEYGYITIPLMAFTSFLIIIILMLIRKSAISKVA